MSEFGKHRHRQSFRCKLALATTALVLGGAPSAFADTLIDDPLHAFCYGASSCSDNGTVTPTTTNPPHFGFSISPAPQTGDFYVDILGPNNDSAVSFAITGTKGGANNTSIIGGTASKFSSSAWTSGNLVDFLGINGQNSQNVLANGAPKNPIDAWLPSTKGVDSAATSYFVYQANLGTNKLNSNAIAPTTGPLLNISTLPVGGLVVGLMETSRDVTTTTCAGTGKHKVCTTTTTTINTWGTTAQSGALFQDRGSVIGGGGGDVNTPLPAALPLMGTVLGAGYLVSMWRRRRGAAGSAV